MKVQKLAKGYSLQPVLVNPVAEAAPPLIVSGKRERKKSNHFGTDAPCLTLPCDTHVDSEVLRGLRALLSSAQRETLLMRVFIFRPQPGQ